MADTATAGRLVVMSCGAKKRDQATRAVDLYTGSGFQTLRKHNAGTPVVILSAEHGLVEADRQLAPYDRRMDAPRADELVEPAEILRAIDLVAALRLGPLRDVFCHGGALYRQVVERYAAAGVFGTATVDYSHGGIGEQRSQLGRFLRSEAING